jgi:hypothetical protein
MCVNLNWSFPSLKPCLQCFLLQTLISGHIDNEWLNYMYLSNVNYSKRGKTPCSNVGDDDGSFENDFSDTWV